MDVKYLVKLLDTIQASREHHLLGGEDWQDPRKRWSPQQRCQCGCLATSGKQETDPGSRKRTTLSFMQGMWNVTQSCKETSPQMVEGSHT